MTCDHDWRDEMIVDAERCARCGEMRVVECRHGAPTIEA